MEASARMLEATREIAEQLQRDKLEALAEFAAGAGHEINNPIATISGGSKDCFKAKWISNAAASF